MTADSIEQAMAAANGRPAPGAIVDPRTGEHLSGGIDPTVAWTEPTLTDLGRRIFEEHR